MLVSAAEVDGVAVGVVELVTGSGVVELVAWVVGRAYGLVWSNEWNELSWCWAVAAILASWSAGKTAGGVKKTDCEPGVAVLGVYWG